MGLFRIKYKKTRRSTRLEACTSICLYIWKCAYAVRYFLLFSKSHKHLCQCF